MTLKQVLKPGSELDNSPFIIAEMSGNHGTCLETALKIIDAAAETGADAIKLQTFTADSMTLDIDDDDFKVTKKESPWFGRSLYDLFNEAHTPREWHKQIFDRAREKGILCFSTPFDESAVDFLESLDAPAYKIASFENVDIPLIKYVAETGKPLIISTGMASVAEIIEAVDAAKSAGCKQLTILKCTSSYPAPAESCNLNTIPHLAQLIDCEVGLSDHTLGIGAAITATVLGASVIEKHFTLDRSDGAVDALFSLEPDEMASLVRETKTAKASLGKIFYGVSAAEESAKSKRRSIYVVKEIKAGEAFTKDNIRRIRPGRGLAPKHYEEILNQKSNSDLPIGTPLSWEYINH